MAPRRHSSLQQVATVQKRDLLQRLRRLLPAIRVNVVTSSSTAAGSSNTVLLGPKGCSGVAEILPEVVEGLPETRARLLVAHRSPEQSRQLIAAMHVARRHGEIRE